MKQLGIKYGLIAGLIYIISGLINYMFDLQTKGSGVGILMWFVTFAVTFAVVYVAVKELRFEQGHLTTGEGVKLGVTIGLIAGILGGLFSLLYTQVIDPDLMARQMSVMEEAWEEQGMTDEQIDQARSWTEMFTKPMLTIPVAVIFYVIGGLIKGAISGAILKQGD